LGLSDPITKALSEVGFEEPTDIQKEAIPLLIKNPSDLIGLAQTGTGKTAAFGLPLLEMIDANVRHTQALVLSPTRELAKQITEQLLSFSKHMKGVKIVSVYGGAPISHQIKDLRSNPQVIVATPGRLIDLIGRKAVRLKDISYVVLDEADEMLNMGFKEDMDKILSFTPEDKSTWLFSATMPKEIRKLINTYMTNPHEVSVGQRNEVNQNIEHQYVQVKSRDKSEALKRFLDSEPGMRGIIFCRTKANTQTLADELMRLNYRSAAIHGDLDQKVRERVMNRFRNHELQVLVATDVAARGIDVDDLTHVIHHSLPDDMAYYTHRSGRTARAGKKGISLSFVTSTETRKVKYIEKQLKLNFKKVNVPSVVEIKDSKMQQWAENLLRTVPGKAVDQKLLDLTLLLFEGLSKEELVKKLLTNELNRLGYNDRGNKDLNDRSEGSGKSDGKGNNKFAKDWYFINIGKGDDLSKKDLLEFICDQTKIDRRDVGDIVLQRKNSFFEVNKKHAKKMTNAFKGIVIDGRELRVNKDDRGGGFSRKKR